MVRFKTQSLQFEIAHIDPDLSVRNQKLNNSEA